MQRRTELLSPAKDLATAKAAILCGADAVYMGASAFGARQNAANSLEDVAAAADFAHSYGAKLYITLNTILTDAELAQAQPLAWQLYEAGIDAFIVQDMGFLTLKLPPLPLHASTQCHIDSPQKARFLEAAGFDTLVLARELTLSEIAEISKSVKARIECFVHGALCVSYSGQCNLSHAIGGRSGNRGECAQPCRLEYDFEDSAGASVAPRRHYLSLKDMGRAANLGELLDAGVCAFKIEGRLKDISYVKNVTLFYRRALDIELAKRGLKRASLGVSRAEFAPDLNKSFNRGLTPYHLHDIQKDCAAFESPKSKGEFLGLAQKVCRGGFFEPRNSEIKNGDGLFIENPDGASFGARVQRAESGRVILGAQEGLLEPHQVLAGAKIWRNKNTAFEKSIERDAERKIGVKISVSEGADGIEILFKTQEDAPLYAKKTLGFEDRDDARDFEGALAKLKESLSKLGNSAFEATDFECAAKRLPHLKISEINEARRELCESLTQKIKDAARPKNAPHETRAFQGDLSFLPSDYKANVLNNGAKKFYEDAGLKISEYAAEAARMTLKGKRVMLTKHCVLRELGMCKKEGEFPQSLQEPLYLKNGGKTLRLNFDCARCGMEIFFEG